MKKKLIILVSMLSLTIITLLGLYKVSANSRTSMYGENIVNVPYAATGIFTTNNNLCVVNGTISPAFDYFSQSNLSYKNGYLVFDISSSNYGVYGGKLGATVRDNMINTVYVFDSSNNGYLVIPITYLTYLGLWVAEGNYSNFIWDVNVYFTTTLTPIDDAYYKGYNSANTINQSKQLLGPLYDGAYNGYLDYDFNTISSINPFIYNNNINVSMRGNSIDLKSIVSSMWGDWGYDISDVSNNFTNSIIINMFFGVPCASSNINFDIVGINEIHFLGADNNYVYSITNLLYRNTTNINVPISANVYGIVLVINNYSEFVRNDSYMTIVDNTSYYYKSGYNMGYSDGIEDVEQTYFDKIEKSFDDGYNVGYDNGYQQGVADENPVTLTSLMFSIGQIPINMISSIFNFEVFGVNLFSALCSILTLLLVVWAIRKFL